MKNRLFLLLILAITLTSCKDSSIKISGKINNQQKGEYLMLQELKANSLKTVDSIKMSDDGKFSFEQKIEIPTFYLLKSSNQNFLTILAKPGENLNLTAEYNKLGL